MLHLILRDLGNQRPAISHNSIVSSVGLLVLFIKLEITLASNSTSRVLMCICRRIYNSSLKAQNSARKLAVVPIFLANALTQEPESLQRIPPPPATPRLPREAPSVFNLNQPLTCLSHRINFSTLGLLTDRFFAEKVNSAALWITSLWMEGLGGVFLKTTLLQWFHKV